MYHEMFPPEILAMQEEIQMHPALLSNLLQMPPNSALEDKMGEVAAFVGIILDGYYGNDEILELAEEITKRLRAARVELILEINASKIN